MRHRDEIQFLASLQKEASPFSRHDSANLGDLYSPIPRAFITRPTLFGPTATSRHPELISFNGSKCSSEQIFEVSVAKGIRSAQTSIPKPEASANSHKPFKTPPSVGSCRAWTPTIFEMPIASSTMLMCFARL